MKPWEKIIPSKERKWLLPKQQTQVRQCLSDLGYWVAGVQEDFKTALLQFRKEGKAAHLLSVKAADSKQRQATIAEEQLLKNLLSLEGEFPVQQLPAQNVLNLSVRLLHYRLHLLGLYPIDPAYNGLH